MTTSKQLTKLIEQCEDGTVLTVDMQKALEDYWDLIEDVYFALERIDEQVAELRRVIKDEQE